VNAPSGPPAESASGPRYVLRPSVEAFVNRDGHLCFLVPGERDLVVREPDDIDVALVRRLHGSPDTADAVIQSVEGDPTLIRQKLDSLVSAGLVLVREPAQELPLSDEDAARFSRQLPYLLELGDDVRLQRRLRAATVAVIGCGGLGTWTVAALACIGVGHLVLVDDDRVTLSNLNRQVLYTRRHVGAAKVAAAEDWLRAFDPASRVTALNRRIAAAEDADPVVAGADAVVLAADSPPYDIGRWVNTACIKSRTPFIVAGQLPPMLKIGPTYVPGEGPCFVCHETALTNDSYAYADYVAFRRSEGQAAVTLGPASCVAGGLMGLELLHLLTGQAPVTRDLALLVHMRTLEVRRESVARDQACPACKHLY
jgi:bacteriocin biosynthesis cyclodehydratase domain-containing protein